MFLKSLGLIAAVSVLSVSSIATAASADGRWDARHPRQDQVIDRAAHQRHEIRREMAEGDLSRAQGRHLIARDNRVVRVDHRLAHAQGGHISRHEQRLLNHRENRIHRHIPA